MGMIEGTYYKMGVAYDIPNYRFIYGEPISGTLQTNSEFDTAITINTPTIDIRNSLTTVADDVGYVDEIVIGPSTATNFTDRKESWKIDTIVEATNGFNLNILRKLKHYQITSGYDDGDVFSFYSNKMPKDWTISYGDYGTGNGNVIVHTLNQLYDKPNFFGEGSWYDDFAFSLNMYSTQNTWTATNPVVRLDMTKGYLNPSTIYRYGVGYKAYSESDVVVAFIAGTDLWSIQTQGNTSIATNADDADWIERTTIGVSVDGVLTGGAVITPANVYTTLPHFRFTSYSPDGALNDLNLKISYMFLEHAKGTDGEDAGVYTFPEYPELGSTSFLPVEVRSPQASGEFNSKRFIWNAQFRQASHTFLKNLMILNFYQKIGYKMYFHLNEEAGSNLPNILKGNFRISGLTQDFWHKEYFNFNFTFTEE